MPVVKTKRKKPASKEKAVKKEPARLELAVFNKEGNEVSRIELNPQIFGLKINTGLIKQSYEAQMSQSRTPYAHAKDRSEVKGGGKKPWRQKGTGRSRHGSIRSPIWRGGGVTFGPRKEKKFAKKINRKMRRKALLMVLSGKARDNELIFLDELKLEQPKTKEMVMIIRQLAEKVKNDIKKGGLVVLPSKDENIVRATRNIPKFLAIGAGNLNIVDLLNYKYVLMPKQAAEVIEKTYLK